MTRHKNNVQVNIQSRAPLVCFSHVFVADSTGHFRSSNKTLLLDGFESRGSLLAAVCLIIFFFKKWANQDSPSAAFCRDSLAQEEKENECESGEKKLPDEHHRFSLARAITIRWAQLVWIFYNQKMLGTLLIYDDSAVLKMNTGFKKNCAQCDAKINGVSSRGIITLNHVRVQLLCHPALVLVMSFHDIRIIRTRILY